MKTKQTLERPTPAALAAAPCYAAHQLLDILSEARRNIVNGTNLMNNACFDHAAKQFEIAADKLRVVQRDYDASFVELESERNGAA